jgi:hypothetical protein
MKNLYAFVLLLSGALFIGCTENIPTDPDMKLLKQDSQLIKDKIPICCQVCDPLSGMCRLNGCVEYTHQLVAGTENRNGLYTILLDLKMNSQLCDKCMIVHLEWLIKGNSQESVNVSEDGIALLDKSYSITNRDDVVLYVRYMVTTDGVGIVSTSIVEVE